MPAGTLTLTNNSAVVKGAGTAFSTELKAGDMIVSVVGGVTYTLPVKTVDNAAQVTLIKAYDGPTQAGAAWYAVPREALNSITAQLAAETAKALRGLNYDKANWQQVFSGTGDVTITLPDNSTYTGPAWNALSERLTNVNDKLVGKVDLIDVPLGIISMWPLATPPDGFKICDGSAFDKSVYPKLAKIFTNGVLPDFRGVFPRGHDRGRGLNPNQALLQYINDKLKRHKHMPSAAFIRDVGAGTNFIGDKQIFPIVGNRFASASFYNWQDSFNSDWFYMQSTYNNEPADETAPKSIAVNFIVRAS